LVTRSHKLRSRLILASAILLILLAVTFSLFRLLAPHVSDYADRIQSEISRKLGVPVEIGMVSVDTWRMLPQLKLMDVSVYDASGQRHLIHFDEVMVGMNWSASLMQWRPVLGHVVLNGWNLQARHEREGDWVIQGVVIPKSEGPFELPPEIADVLQYTSVYLEQGQIDWEDAQHNSQRMVLSDVRVAMINEAPRHQLSLDVELPRSYGQHVQIKADMRGPLTQPDQWRGQLYVSLDKLQVKRVMNDYWQYFDFTAEGVLDANVWLDWNKTDVQQLHMYVNGDGMALHYLNDTVQSWKLDNIIGTARWQHNDEGWQADVRGLQIRRNQNTWLQPASISVNLDNKQQQLTAQANYLRLGDLVYLTGLAQAMLPDVVTAWNTPLQAWQPHGDVYDFDLQLPLNNPQDLSAQARFADLSYLSHNAAPSAKGLDGRVRYGQGKASVDFDARNVELDFGKLFRQPLKLTQIQGAVELEHVPGQWQVRADDLALVSPHISTRNRVRVYIPENGPVFMDLFGRFAQGQSQFTHLYLPVGIMHADTVHWLDRAIGKGDVTRGGVVFYGNLNEFPFDHGEGVLQVMFDAEKLRLDYFEHWPAIDNLAARVRFHNRSMEIDQARGNIYGTTLSNTQVAINDMSHAQLDISGDVSGPLPEFIRFVADSPLQKPLAYVSEMKTSGTAKLNLGLTIPLSGDDPVRVNGKLKFENDGLQLPNLDYRFSKLNGELAFTESGFSSPALSTMLDGYVLGLHIEPVQIDNIPHSRIFAQGRVPAASVAAPLPVAQKKLSGIADWQVSVDVPLQTRADGIEAQVNVKSDLKGVVSDLPFALRKTADESGDFGLQLAVLGSGGLNIQIDYADKYHAQMQERNEWWNVSADSASLRGQAKFKQGFPADQKVTAAIDYVDMSAMSAGEESATTEPEEGENKLLPREIPPLDLAITKMQWDGREFQDIKLQTRQSALGMVIDKIEARASHMTLTGSGSWLSSWRTPHTTTLDFKLRSDDLGAALNDLAAVQALEKTRGEAGVHWQWKAQPYAFDWTLLNGDADIKLEDGRLKDVEAGTGGRVLGLLNFRTLLSLDFGSQVGGGFAFDDITGRVRFDEGNAYTDEFRIQGKAAEVRMNGRIGLVAEDYDQHITVIPGVGNTLTLIGAVAGGPVTGVMVHLFQKLVGVDKIAKYQYTVKGNWDKPRVKLISAPENTANAAGQ